MVCIHILFVYSRKGHSSYLYLFNVWFTHDFVLCEDSVSICSLVVVYKDASLNIHAK